MVVEGNSILINYSLFPITSCISQPFNPTLEPSINIIWKINQSFNMMNKAGVRPYCTTHNNTKLHTKPTPPLTHQQPRTLQQTSQFTQGGQERKQQEGADSETFFSSLVDISK